MNRSSTWSIIVGEAEGKRWKDSCFKVVLCAPNKIEESLKAKFDQSKVRGGILQPSLLIHALKGKVNERIREHEHIGKEGR